MDVNDVISTEYDVLEPDTRVSKLKGFFQETGKKAVLVVGDEFEGVVTRRQLITSHYQPEAKLRKITTNPPKVGRHDDVREVARQMVESDSKVVPVFEGDEIVGVVTVDDLLAEVNSNLSVLDVDDVYTSELVTVGEDTSVGQIINKFREHAISRVPVMDEGRLVGIVTLYDMLGFSVRDEDRQQGSGNKDGQPGGQGSRHGDLDRMLDIPAVDVMNSPVETTTTDESLSNAVEKMLKNDYSSLVVQDNVGPSGMLTKTDVLRALTWQEEEQRLPVQVTNIDLLGTMSREDVADMVTDVTDKYKDLQVLHTHVHLKQHKEQMRGNHLIHSKIILHTNKGQFVATGEGFGTRHSLRLSRDRLERKVLGEKGVKRSDRDAERLLKELGL